MKLRSNAAIALLILFLLANIHASLNHKGAGARQLGPTYLPVRIPLQLWLIGVAIAVLRLDPSGRAAGMAMRPVK